MRELKGLRTEEGPLESAARLSHVTAIVGDCMPDASGSDHSTSPLLAAYLHYRQQGQLYCSVYHLGSRLWREILEEYFHKVFHIASLFTKRRFFINSPKNMMNAGEKRPKKPCIYMTSHPQKSAKVLARDSRGSNRTNVSPEKPEDI